MLVIEKLKGQMKQVVSGLEDDLRTLRPGRASAELIADLPVSCYGGRSPLQQLAGISNNEQGDLIVQPWDRSIVAVIEAAIRQSQLGFSVVNSGSLLRLGSPPLSQERREELARLASQKGEAARVALRQIRSDAHHQAVKSKSLGQLREDELTRTTKNLNDLIDEFNSQVKVVTEAKVKELLGF